MMVCTDAVLLELILRRIALMRAIDQIKITRPKKQPKRVARQKRLRRALGDLNSAIAERCYEIFTP